MSYHIAVVPYNPDWPRQFAEEAAQLAPLFGDNLITIHHIGSTSVPGLAAKPLIDMLPVVKDIRLVDELFLPDYIARGELGIAFRRFFHKGDEERTHHLHCFEEGNPEIERHLLFRDHLRTHPADRQAYESLKLELAQKYADERDRYTEGKQHLIHEIQHKTGFQGLSLVQALTTHEWTAYHQIRQGPFRESPQHYHFVLYKGTEIIGMLSIERPDQILELTVEAPHEQTLRTLADKWLQHQKNSLIPSVNMWHLLAKVTPHPRRTS